MNLHGPFSLRKTAIHDGRSQDGAGSGELDGRDESHDAEETNSNGFGSDASGATKGPTEDGEAGQIDEERDGDAEGETINE